MYPLSHKDLADHKRLPGVGGRVGQTDGPHGTPRVNITDPGVLVLETFWSAGRQRGGLLWSLRRHFQRRQEQGSDSPDPRPTDLGVPPRRPAVFPPVLSRPKGGSRPYRSSPSEPQTCRQRKCVREPCPAVRPRFRRLRRKGPSRLVWPSPPRGLHTGTPMSVAFCLITLLLLKRGSERQLRGFEFLGPVLFGAAGRDIPRRAAPPTTTSPFLFSDPSTRVLLASLPLWTASATPSRPPST